MYFNRHMIPSSPPPAFSLRPEEDRIVVGHPPPVAASVETVLRRSPRMKNAVLRARVARCEFNLFQERVGRRHDQQKYQSIAYFPFDTNRAFYFFRKCKTGVVGVNISLN